MTSLDTLRVVRRSWPRGDDAVLEMTDGAGSVSAGCRRADGGVEVYEPGTDHGLPGLSAVVGLAGGPEHVVAHRLARRALVHHGGQWIKVVRRAKVDALARRHQVVASLVAGTGLRVPALVAVDERRGALVLDHLEGIAMLDHPDPVAAAEQVAATLIRWARLRPPRSLPIHGPDAEHAVLSSWARAASRHHAIPPAARSAFAAAVASAAVALSRLGARPLTLSHRDLHDAQLLVDGDHVGVLDLDTASLADPALDLGNLLAHVDLAAALGRLDAASTDAVQGALCTALADRRHHAAVEAYRAAARARLVAVHAFRPATRTGALALLAPVTR